MITTDRAARLEQVAARLRAADVPTPEVDARLLVDAVASRHPGDPEGPVASGELDRLVARRAAREPLQLVVGHAGFRWVDVTCRPGVFVPRPETEVVAGVAIEAALACGRRPRVVEPCTGTGAIACAVASEAPGARVVASDLSDAAVALARDNLARMRENAPPSPWRPGPWLAPGATAEVRRGDLRDAVPAEWRGAVDVVVANPPYLPASDETTWEPEVADHDPRASLVGGPDGHEVVDALLGMACSWLRPGGLVVVEIDERRGPDAAAVARHLGLDEVRIVTDLAGADRAVVGRRPSAGQEQGGGP